MFTALALASLVSTVQVQGTVLEQHSRWQDGLIVTDTTLRVDGVSAGDAPAGTIGSAVTVRHLGGVVDGVAQVAFGEDSITAASGQHVVVGLVREGTTWFVAASAHDHFSKSETGGTTSTDAIGYVRAMTDINQSCSGEPIALHWPEGDTHYVRESDTPNGVSAADAEVAVRASFDAWATVGCSYFGLSFDGQVDHPQVGYNGNGDNTNVVAYVEHDWQGKRSTQAITLLTFGCNDGVILDADILVNADNFRFTTDPENDDEDRRDLQNVLTHEAGHFVGFAHSPDPASTMFATVTADETQKRDLTDSDRAGMCVAYPVERGPLDAGSPLAAGCSVAAGGSNGGNRGLATGLALLAIFSFAGLKSRARRSNHARGR
jgi:hypothetical protein